jgi:hypothetical protein
MQQLFEEDVGRKYDPLGQDAYVPATVKKEAVSHWLHDQQRNRKLHSIISLTLRRFSVNLMGMVST